MSKPQRFLRLAEVQSRVPRSKSGIYTLIAAGQFPRPYALGPRSVGWLEADVEHWIEGRLQRQPAANSQTEPVQKSA
jgi:prophage regulatory protein